MFVWSLKFGQELGVERGDDREKLPEQGAAGAQTGREARVRVRDLHLPCLLPFLPLFPFLAPTMTPG